MNVQHLRVFLLALLTLVLMACSGPRVMMPTPNVYVE